tara:strand:+ start:269 stop:376 length:108 start_codon:yes stop_codon:yes gene_type:complete
LEFDRVRKYDALGEGSICWIINEHIEEEKKEMAKK